jgi:3-deoxy-7-phosphoheptulonate synthase
MIIVMKQTASQANIDHVVDKLHHFGLEAHLSSGKQVTIIGVIGDKSVLADANLEILDGVDKLVAITESYKLSNRKFNTSNTVIHVGDCAIGGGDFVVMAGPCAIESHEQIFETAKAMADSGVKILRGGAFKPRTSPYSFQGLEKEGLEMMKEAGDAFNMKLISEITSLRALEIAVDYLDILQIGARNMHNFELLKEVGRTGKPVFLKRGLSATVEEWINAAEYIMRENNPNVILCERGIRTFETGTRNTLDISAVPAIKKHSHLPVFVDPSHATGIKDYVLPLSRSAVAAGADGLMIEVHPHPDVALSDGPQSLTPNEFKALMIELKPFLALMGKKYDI